MKDEDVFNKWKTLAGPHFGQNNIEKQIETVMKLEELESLAELMPVV